ncbi:MAG: altronate dehydratase [Clostridia bacterium]|nr:altronate dehydratase [Clostridia bacterium]
MHLITIHPRDNVSVNPDNGQKYARTPIAAGEQIIKYGSPIGIATRDIAPGDHVHRHNMRTALKTGEAYRYEPDFAPLEPRTPGTFRGYLRPDGRAGIRNEVWIIPTVGCVNGPAQEIARATGAIPFPHPYGCSQLGEDHETTRRILRGLALHPNAGGVLVLGLGCENNIPADFRKFVGGEYGGRIRYLVSQEVEDEVAEGIRIVRELQEFAAKTKPTDIPVSKLSIGLKCGGSDGLSGITANPLIGRVSDRVLAEGGSTVLTEVPEMFGAERLLMKRCVSEEVFRDTVWLIDHFKEYFVANGEPISENPTPGNVAGGISTLEEKSLGCTQKSGSAPVSSVLRIGDQVPGPGLHLLDGPGNDLVAVTNLAATGCQLILFSTGRGTPLGAAVPTIKIATNTPLAQKKAKWIDFDAGPCLEGDLIDELYKTILEVASGKPTQNELRGARDISLFKNGVIL